MWVGLGSRRQGYRGFAQSSRWLKRLLLRGSEVEVRECENGRRGREVVEPTYGPAAIEAVS